MSGSDPHEAAASRSQHSPTLEQRRAALAKAREKVRANQWDVLDPWRFNEQLDQLEVFGELEQRRALLQALEEIVAKDYRGTFPPELSYEDECKDAPLFPFAWISKSRGNSPMYLKFAFHNDRLVVISFHRQRSR